MKRLRSNFAIMIRIITMIVFGVSGWTLVSDENSTAMTPETVQGQYEGYIPCADCPGVNYKLLTLGMEGEVKMKT